MDVVHGFILLNCCMFIKVYKFMHHRGPIIKLVDSLMFYYFMHVYDYISCQVLTPDYHSNDNRDKSTLPPIDDYF